MLRKLVLGMCAALLMVGMAAAPASASTSTPVTIQSSVVLGPFTGTWSASGGISDSGTLLEPSVNPVGNGEVHIVRDVTGALGTFTLRIDSKISGFEPDGSPDFTGHWVVVSGTGAYANLRGQGRRAAVARNGVVTETLTGEVHYD